MSADLIAFMRARLDETEASALAASQPHAWEVDGDGETADVNTRTRQPSIPDYDTVCRGVATADALHIVRHDPARVLREVAAKRAIVDRYALATTQAGNGRLTLEERVTWAAAARALFMCVQDLAAVHAGRPEYRQEWAP